MQQNLKNFKRSSCAWMCVMDVVHRRFDHGWRVRRRLRDGPPARTLLSWDSTLKFWYIAEHGNAERSRYTTDTFRVNPSPKKDQLEPREFI
ncbi:hypothetical protein BDZ45DRAFT_676504 [Acephala macrosclerotiorum]|nr:hypothetical protein BDZ45DRAFT_676504 [Acephala macrosclerotiorum]